MIDLILAAAVFATFYAGFKAGNSFKTLRELALAAIGKFESK